MNKYLNELVIKIGGISEPVTVPVIVESYARSAFCFPNVDDKVKRDGGSVVYGWSVLEGKFLIEAERHAIWKSPTAELIDVTPSTSELPTTLFIEQDLVYKGQYIDNHRINRTENKVVDDWINVCELRSKILNTATRDGDYITFPVFINDLYYRIEMLNNYYYSYLMTGGTETTNCFCSSRKPYNRCHGLTNSKDCERDSQRVDYLMKNNKVV
jgi:hypothetical protein